MKLLDNHYRADISLLNFYLPYIQYAYNVHNIVKYHIIYIYVHISEIGFLDTFELFEWYLHNLAKCFIVWKCKERTCHELWKHGVEFELYESHLQFIFINTDCALSKVLYQREVMTVF